MGAAAIDRFRDGGGADEADAGDVGVGDDGFDGFAAALDDLEDVGGQAGFGEEFGEDKAGRGVLLGGFEDEAIAGGECDRDHPERDHGGEVEGRDAGDDAEGLAHGPAVDPGCDGFGVFAFEEMGDAAGEFDHFDAALHFAFGIGQGFAVFGGDGGGDALGVALHQFLEFKHDAGAAQRGGGGPGGPGGVGGGDGGVNLGGAAHGDLA